LRRSCLLLLALFTVAALGADAPLDPPKKEAVPEKTSEQDVATIKDAIGRLAANEFDVRQKASDDLIAMGKKAMPFLSATQKQMDDSEVRERATRILAKIEEKIGMEGLTTLPSGLQYKVIKEGDGESPGPTDTVVVHYTGKLKDGTEFDSSYKRGKPASFPVNRVITGWTEALQKMKPGSKWVLVIPPKLAYGEAGISNIPPNSTLIFDVELISIVKK